LKQDNKYYIQGEHETLIRESKFFKCETNFLAYIVSYNVFKTDPGKIATIPKYPLPKNI